MATYEASKAASELREQISSSKRRIGFFLGAGTSMSAGLPGIKDLTSSVEGILNDDAKKHFLRIKESIANSPNVEDVLNRIRIYRELLANSSTKRQDELTEDDAKGLDLAVCQAITRLVGINPPAGIDSHLRFAKWIYALHADREYPVEIFTTNYDLILEKALEAVGVPFFDGFVGAVQPFFSAVSVEADKSASAMSAYPPTTWTRLWKLHGSVAWHLIKAADGASRVIRVDGIIEAGEQLMVFPSRDKYLESRKLPFVSFHDHLRRFLTHGEVVLVICGYSFSDQHLTEIIFDGLRANSRLAVTALVYEKYETTQQLGAYAKEHPNFTICWPDKVIIGGVLADWTYSVSPAGPEKDDLFWDSPASQYKLGRFKELSAYLDSFTRL